MRKLVELWAKEPAMVVGVVSALIAVAAAIGLAVTDELAEAIYAAITAIGAILGALITRSQVTPVADPAPEVITQAVARARVR